MTDPAPSVRIEAAYAVIRLPDDTRAQLCTELADCPCPMAKSAATQASKRWLFDALADPPVRVPLRDVHGVRVALGDCPCRPVKDMSSVRRRLSAALAKTGC